MTPEQPTNQILPKEEAGSLSSNEVAHPSPHSQPPAWETGIDSPSYADIPRSSSNNGRDREENQTPSNPILNRPEDHRIPESSTSVDPTAIEDLSRSRSPSQSIYEERQTILGWSSEPAEVSIDPPPDSRPQTPAIAQRLRMRARQRKPDLPRSPRGYQLIKKLGQGGMGVVYLARRLDLDRLVALKMIRRPALAHPDALERMTREARILAKLDHPHIVRIFEIGTHEGLPFLALEYLEGGSLAQHLGGRPMRPRAAAELIALLARAVDAAHAQGIVHRDLKPANVIYNRFGVPKITDFGLAKQFDTRPNDVLLEQPEQSESPDQCIDESATPLDQTSLLSHNDLRVPQPATRFDEDDGEEDASPLQPGQWTLPGDVLGTPSYMAPEQAAGEIDMVGPASDQHALGAMLYEMLTGRPPFSSTTQSGLLFQVVHFDPIAPGRLASVPRDLETICLTCLAKSPKNRYPSVAALADDLQRFLDGRPIRARRISWMERGFKWARRHPVVTVGLVLATTTLGMLGWTVQNRLLERRQTIGRVQARLEGLTPRIQRLSQTQTASDLAAARQEIDTLQDEVNALRLEVGEEVWKASLAPNAPQLAALERQRAQIESQLRQRERLDAWTRRHAEFQARFEQIIRSDLRFSGPPELDDPAPIRFELLLALDFVAVGQPGRPETLRFDPDLPFDDPSRRELLRGQFRSLMQALAEAVARPTSNEDPAAQARLGLTILERLADPQAQGWKDADPVPLRNHTASADDSMPSNPIPSPGLLARRARLARQAGLAAIEWQSRFDDLWSLPQTAEDYEEAGRIAARRREWSRALDWLRRAVEAEPNRFWSHALIALIHFQLGNSDQAVDAWNTALLINPERPWMLMHRGLALSESALTQTTLLSFTPVDQIEAARQRIERLRRSSEADFLNARIGAEAEGDRRLLFAITLNHGLSLLRHDQFAESRKVLEVAETLWDNQVSAHLAFAEWERRQGNLPAALDRLQRARMVRPDLAEIPRLTARLRREPLWRNDPLNRLQALEDLQTAARLESDPIRRADDLALAAQLFLEDQKPTQALDSATEALRLDPTHPQAALTRLVALMELDRHDELIPLIEPALRDASPRRRAELLKLRGLAHAQLGQFSTAIDDFTQALSLRESEEIVDADLLRHRGWALLATDSTRLALDDFQAALAQIAQARKTPPVDLLTGTGLALVKRQKVEPALALARQAATLDPQGRSTRLNIAKIQAQAALITMRNALDPSTRDPRRLAHTARLLATQAIQSLQEAAATLAPSMRNDFLMNQLRESSFRALLTRFPELMSRLPIAPTSSP